MLFTELTLSFNNRNKIILNCDTDLKNELHWQLR